MTARHPGHSRLLARFRASGVACSHGLGNGRGDGTRATHIADDVLVPGADYDQQTYVTRPAEGADGSLDIREDLSARGTSPQLRQYQSIIGAFWYSECEDACLATIRRNRAAREQHRSSRGAGAMSPSAAANDGPGCNASERSRGCRPPRTGLLKYAEPSTDVDALVADTVARRITAGNGSPSDSSPPVATVQRPFRRVAAVSRPRPRSR